MWAVPVGRNGELAVLTYEGIPAGWNGELAVSSLMNGYMAFLRAGTASSPFRLCGTAIWRSSTTERRARRSVVKERLYGFSESRNGELAVTSMRNSYMAFLRAGTASSPFCP